MESFDGGANGAAVPADEVAGRSQSLHRLLTLLERADVVFYRLRLQPDLHVEQISSHAERLTGYPAEQFAADPQLIWRVVHPDDRRRLDLLFADPAQSTAPSSFRIVHRDGRVLHVEHVGMLTRNDRDAPLRIEGIVRDVTVLHVPGHEPATRGACEDVPAAVYLGHGTEFAALSPAIEVLTGFSAEDWIRQPTLWIERLHPDDRARILFLATAGAAGQAWQAEYRWLARDGRIVWIRQTSAPIRGGHGELICLHGMLLDGSTTREAASPSVAEQRMDAIARLAGVVAHDFNNLLTVILGHAEMLLDKFVEPGAAHDSALEIRNAGEAVARMTNQLLALSGRQALALRPVDLNEAIRGAADTLHDLAGGEVDLRLDLGPGLPLVDVDVRQFERVLRNLIVDARDAMPGGGRLTITTRAVQQADRRDVRLTLADTRPQLLEEQNIAPFEPSIVSRKAPRGSGLNRAAVYGVIRQSGGRISVDAAPGGGMIFTIVFPAKQAHA